MNLVRRSTTETRVEAALAFGSGSASVATGDAFLDHMLTALARYSSLDLRVEARGDLRHHLVEDVAITAGEALRQVVPPLCRRYAERTIAMDDALVQVVIDAGGRFFYQGPLPSTLYDHFMRSFADAARLTLHVRVLRGRDRHHVVEAAFKGLGLALRDALSADGAVASTKGAVALERA